MTKPELPSAGIDFMQGHNSGAMEMTQEGINSTGARLCSFIERVERLLSEKEDIALDVKGVYSEAKSDGFDVKIIREIIKIRKKDSAARSEEEALLEIYMSAIGM